MLSRLAKVPYVIQLITQYLVSGAPNPVVILLLSCALVWFIICAAVLFGFDIRQHRLPNAWTGRFFVCAAILLLATTLTAAEASGLDGRWLTTLLGSVGYTGVMFVLHLLTRGGLGMGDVKLAAGLGLYTGFIGVNALVAGFTLAFIVGGIQAVYLVLFRGAKKTTRIAFGPAMLIGCLLALLM